MSRSYKKNPIVKDNGYSHRYAKKQASKKVRQSKELSNGCFYKLVYCSYNICDVWRRSTLNEHLDYWGRHIQSKIVTKSFTTIQYEINQWKKWYIRK